MVGILGICCAESWLIAQSAAAQQPQQAPTAEKQKYTPDQQQRINEAAQLDEQIDQLYRQGKYAEAAKFGEQVLTIRKEVLGEKHPDYAESLNSQAELYCNLGNYTKAETLYLQALAIRKQVLGEEHVSYAASLNNLAELYGAIGEYSKAEPLYQQALAIDKKTIGEKNPDYATDLNNLAFLYFNLGDYVKAEPLYQQALSIRKLALGERHPDYAESLNNLAELYQSMGDNSKAEPLYKQALAIRKQVLGERHPDYAESLNNLADLYRSTGDFTRTEPLYKQALAIDKITIGDKHPDYATDLNNLAGLYEDMGEYARAEPLYKQALSIRKAALGEKHPDYAESLNSLAGLYDDMGDYAQAELLCRQALSIRKAALGEKHPDYAESLNSLARLYDDMGDYAQAESLARQALQILREQLDSTATIQSERQQLSMADKVRFHLDNYLTIAQSANVPAEQVYAEVLAWKGSVSARQQVMRQLRSRQQDPNVTALYRQLADTARQLDSLSRATAKPELAEAHRHQLEQLNERLETLQQQLAAASAAFRRGLAQQRFTPDDLERALPAGIVLVDLLEYWHHEPSQEKGRGPTWENRIAAFVVRPQQTIEWIGLGPSAPIAAAVDRWRKSYSTAEGAELRRLVWQPLEDKLTGATTVLVSPDGALDRFPLEALPGKKDGTYLIEDLAIATVPIPRLLPELLAEATSSAPAATKPSLLTVGDVDFKVALLPKAQPEQLALRAPLNREGGGWQFGPLDGTRAEIVAINDSFEQRFPDGQHQSLRKAQATKQAVCEAMPRYSYLHLATHGFFAPPELRSALADNRSIDNSKAAEPKPDARSGALDVAGYHPDLLVGLALAGANQEAEPGQDDGILTALAVEELDLSHVQLATLSACETGLGQTAGGEGVLGLQRAFQLAGARSTVATLWKIPDKASQLLMTDFYENLWDQDKHLPKLEALRQAQLKMLREGGNRGLELPDDKSANDGRLPPFYWAAFELSGDWR